jgi:hypothetical protein
MRQIKDLLEEMGFKKEAPLSTQVAFVKALIGQTYGVPVKTPNLKELERELRELREGPEQLTLFDEEKGNSFGRKRQAG